MTFHDNTAAELARFARQPGLGALLDALRDAGGYELVAHWRQGEFHHDLVLRRPDRDGVLVVATNCNGGIKEVLHLADEPERWALWRWRCPDNPEFHGELPEILGHVTTVHWFDASELLREDARSEIRPEHRRRVRGGGWELRGE